MTPEESCWPPWGPRPMRAPLPPPFLPALAEASPSLSSPPRPPSPPLPLPPLPPLPPSLHPTTTGGACARLRCLPPSWSRARGGSRRTCIRACRSCLAPVKAALPLVARPRRRRAASPPPSLPPSPPPHSALPPRQPLEGPSSS
eukprot:scaffold94111_cov60-Phaeocystis_antarctica.AAC.2